MTQEKPDITDVESETADPGDVPPSPPPADPGAKDAPESETHDGPAPNWEADLAIYPLGQASDDPGWAIKIVKVWIAIGLGAIVFILWLLFMGLVYD